MAIQQLYLGLGAKKKTYLDDVFSTYLWIGSGSARSINNGINLSGDGGLVWIKERDGNNSHQLFDTTRGATKQLYSDDTYGNYTSTNSLTAFNANGFSIGDNTGINNSGDEVASWSFRKTKGFFDIVEYTGNGSNRTIAHSLGSIPGMIIVKRTDTNGTDWRVYYRGSDGSDTLKLNSGVDKVSSPSSWNSTLPTATHFSLGTQAETNANNGTFIAYLFAGGESSATEATSVDFDGTNDKMTLSATSGDLAFGTGDFTWECWVKFDAVSSTWKTLFQSSTAADNNTFYLSIDSNSVNVGNQSAFIIQAAHTFVVGQWYHVAACRASGTLRMFVNGTEAGSVSDSTNWSASTGVAYIGANDLGNGSWADGHNGKISNMRLVKGTALYTSSFRPPTKPLTNVTNTKLLCLQGSSATSATVIPSGSITNDGATHSTDSPFDDPAAFKFGENGDEGIIKCGSYIGNGSSTGPEINLGWEPQWLLVKNTSTTSTSWTILDSMRGIITGANEYEIYADSNVAEANTNGNRMSLTPRGFKIKDTASYFNTVGDTYIFCAIRRPDGYVGKPAAAGTDVFAIDTGNSSSTIPAMDSGFPVDWAMVTQPGSSADNWAYARLLQGTYMTINGSGTEGNSSAGLFDSNVGFYEGSSYNSNYQSWMWKRHSGFDVVTYKGTSVGPRSIPHSLGITPEMIMVKRRNLSEDWTVYHSGMGHGNPAINYHMQWNTDASRTDGSSNHYVWGGVAPTSTHFSVGGSANPDRTNNTNSNYIALLFASVDGISKCGFYDGSSSDVTITTGFQPRFVIIKSSSTNYPWMVLDSVRGWGSSDDSGDDPYLRLNLPNAQVNFNNGYKTSTGFVVDAGSSFVCQNGHKYIYYAHA